MHYISISSNGVEHKHAACYYIPSPLTWSDASRDQMEEVLHPLHHLLHVVTVHHLEQVR